ncbi:DUF2533 family protein [Bacillus sp. MUM 116]
MVSEVTNQLNEPKKIGMIPSRKLVTKKMILEYANKTKY